MPTTFEQSQHWLAEPEGTRLEFKEAKQNFQFDKLVDYCVALANEGGGKIVLGVSDGRPRHIVGTNAFAEPGRTEAGLQERLAHRIPMEEVNSDAGRVLVVHVPARLPGTAWQINGRYLKRAGDGLAALSYAELRAMFAETGPDFSSEMCPGSALSDLSPQSIEAFRMRWASKSHDERKAQWADEQTLVNAELAVDGRITYAALILFGTRAALGRHLAQAELVFEYRSSEASGPAADRAEFREGFFLWHDTVWDKINQRKDRCPDGRVSSGLTRSRAESGSGVAAGASRGAGSAQCWPHQGSALVSRRCSGELQPRGAINMISAICGSRHTCNILLCKQFVEIPIATKAALVAIRQPIRCKRSRTSGAVPTWNRKTQCSESTGPWKRTYSQRSGLSLTSTRKVIDKAHCGAPMSDKLRELR